MEVGCETVLEARTDEQLVEAASDHVREAHDSYELEEVILAGADFERSAKKRSATDGSIA
jgi:uncharacterized protein DUF1059